MIVADFRIITMGESTSLEEPMEHVVNVLKERNVKHQVGPMGTSVEADDLDTLFDCIKACHEAVRGDGGRVFTQVTIDERLDKEESVDSLQQVRA